MCFSSLFESFLNTPKPSAGLEDLFNDKTRNWDKPGGSSAEIFKVSSFPKNDMFFGVTEIKLNPRIAHYVWYFHRERYFWSIEDAKASVIWEYELVSCFVIFKISRANSRNKQSSDQRIIHRYIHRYIICCSTTGPRCCFRPPWLEITAVPRCARPCISMATGPKTEKWKLGERSCRSDKLKIIRTGKLKTNDCSKRMIIEL